MCVQVGVLALPYCFSYLTWAGGPLLLTLSCATSLYTSYLLACLHQDAHGTRHNSYLELGRAVLGTPGPEFIDFGTCEPAGGSASCLWLGPGISLHTRPHVSKSRTQQHMLASLHRDAHGTRHDSCLELGRAILGTLDTGFVRAWALGVVVGIWGVQYRRLASLHHGSRGTRRDSCVELGRAGLGAPLQCAWDCSS